MSRSVCACAEGGGFPPPPARAFKAEAAAGNFQESVRRTCSSAAWRLPNRPGRCLCYVPPWTRAWPSFSSTGHGGRGAWGAGLGPRTRRGAPPTPTASPRPDSLSRALGDLALGGRCGLGSKDSPPCRGPWGTSRPSPALPGVPASPPCPGLWVPPGDLPPLLVPAASGEHQPAPSSHLWAAHPVYPGWESSPALPEHLTGVPALRPRAPR